MIPKIIIVVDGGIIQAVLSETPTDVIIIDYDIEGVPQNRLTKKVPYYDTNSSYCRIQEADWDSKLVEKLYKFISNDLKTKTHEQQ